LYAGEVFFGSLATPSSVAATEKFFLGSFYGEKERNVKEDIYISNEKNQRKQSKLMGVEQGEKD